HAGGLCRHRAAHLPSRARVEALRGCSVVFHRETGARTLGGLLLQGPRPGGYGRRVIRVLATVLACLACTRGSPQPVPDPRAGSCAYCKMPLSDPRLAGRVVVPGEEPLLFDD